MPLISIDRLDDTRLDDYRSLKQTNHTRWRRIFVAEGAKLVERLLESGLEVESILSGEGHYDRLLPLIPSEVPVYTLPAREIDQLVGFHFHRGVLACGRRPANPTFNQLFPDLDRSLNLVLCPDIKDPENLGTIVRISAAFGVDGIIIGAAGTDPYSRRVLRVSMGTIFRLPVIQTDDWPAMLATLKAAEVEIIATVLDNKAERLIAAPRSRRFALALGSEGHGLTPDFIARCDRKVTIPMAPGVDSLNVAIAAGIFLHHFSRVADLKA